MPAGSRSLGATAAPTDQVSVARDPVLYGLSDPKEDVFESFDPKLTKAPLHLNTARDVVPYTDTASQLKKWLVAVGKDHLKPYITLEIPPSDYCVTGHTCKQPEVTAYRAAVEALVKGVYELHTKEPSVVPLVTRWGAWNEPNYRVGLKSGGYEINPLAEDAPRAALFWKVMQATVSSVCSSCKVAAGEFAQYQGNYDREYLSRYTKTLLTNKAFWTGKPAAWGLHDYKDLVYAFEHHEGSPALEHFRNPDLKQFLHDVSGALGKPTIWLSEQGVELQTGHENTALHGKNLLVNDRRQREAANDFLDLAQGHSRIALADYYLYRGPTPTQLREDHFAFDSALKRDSGVPEAQTPREAYCVIVEGRRKGCPGGGETKGHSAMTASSATVAAEVEPAGLPTTYSFEYGTTTAYGQTTSPSTVSEEAGAQTVTTGLTGLEACKTYHYQVMVENEANEGAPGFGGDGTFKTGGCTATSVTVGPASVCAVLTNTALQCWGRNIDQYSVIGEDLPPVPVPSEVPGFSGVASVAIGDQSHNICTAQTDGHVLCIGKNSHGQLGDGTVAEEYYEGEKAVLTPVRVRGITGATSVADGEEDVVCATLESGHIDCWGDGYLGQLGNGLEEVSPNPVEVTGISNAVHVISISQGFCALLASGHVDCWGSNSGDQLGDGHLTEEENATATPREVSGISTAVGISQTANTVCAVLSGGSVECWGDNQEGAIGNGKTTGPDRCAGYWFESEPVHHCYDTPQKVSGITSASAMSAGCALLTTGTVTCWGNVQAYTWPEGPSFYDSPHAIPGISGAVELAANEDVGCVRVSGGHVECWGGDGYGELGRGSISGPESIGPVDGL